MEYHEIALRLNQKTGNKQEEAVAYVNAGVTYHSLGDYKRAVEYHERALIRANFQSNRLYNSKEAKEYKFYIIKAC